MRPFALVAMLLALGAALAGCSDGPKPQAQTGSDDFEDYDVPEATDTKGVILGVVVDEAIRPVADVKVSLSLLDGSLDEETTDAEGRFAYGDLEPGDYLLRVSHLQYTEAQTTVKVVAGDKDPPVARIQVARLFDQEPYHEQIQFDGYLACAYAIGVSSTCVNDYTRVVGERCLPNGLGCYCAGGCFRDQDLAQQGGNIREYVSTVGPGWQSLVFEMVWEPTSDFGEQLGFTVSFFSRPDAVHRYGGAGGASPVRLQLDTGVEHESSQMGAADHTIVPANGTEELFTFFSANSGSVAINQQFRSFETHFYYGIIPEGWSFVNGDPFPF